MIVCGIFWSFPLTFLQLNSLHKLILVNSSSRGSVVRFFTLSHSSESVALMDWIQRGMYKAYLLWPMIAPNLQSDASSWCCTSWSCTMEVHTFLKVVPSKHIKVDHYPEGRGYTLNFLLLRRLGPSIHFLPPKKYQEYRAYPKHIWNFSSKLAPPPPPKKKNK